MNPEELIRSLIILIGDYPDREGLKETPKRVIDSFKEIYKGYDIKQKPEIKTFSPTGADDSIIVNKGEFNSVCEHHMLTFSGNYFFGYVADKKKEIGLSKIPRVIEWHSARLQTQERLTKEVIKDLEDALNPKGIILILKANHLCVNIRGVKQSESEMVTSIVRGCLKNRQEEFFSLIKV